ncbi:MAG: phosphoadenylyl-sulfate reductase [Thermoguttaceae bacterium]|jgi:phosphoadenosine phosphosulfate reductase
MVLAEPPERGASLTADVRSASPEEIEWLARQSQAMEAARPEDILAWAVQTYFPRFTMATGLGPEGCVIISMLARIEPRVYVFNLDTGYQFRETLQLRERIAERYGMVIDLRRPELTVPQYEARHGGPLYKRDPDRCCFDRKVTVLQRVAAGYDAWATGIRRDQSPTRADTPLVRWDKKFGLVKISPLAAWTKQDVWKRIMDERVPYNPLHDAGYPSIGCWPCTRAVQPGGDERAGRWSGTAKTECGLHVPSSR